MTNADRFMQTFGIYATELWAKSEKEFLKWLNSEEDIDDGIKFYVPKGKTIPTHLFMCVDGVYVNYNPTEYGYRFIVLLDNEEQAMRIVEKIVKRMKYEYDYWRTKSLYVVPQEEEIKINTIIDWEFEVVRDS